MLMTEKEAFKRWCPMARDTAIVSEGGDEQIGAVSANRGYSDGHPIHHFGDVHCVASGCMAWRWLDNETIRTSVLVDDVDGQEGPPPDGDGWDCNIRTGIHDKRRGRYWARVEPNPNRRGYCGAFGRPEV